VVVVATSLVVADTDLLVDFLRDADPGASWVQVRIRDDSLRMTAISAFELRLGRDFVTHGRGIESLLGNRTLPLDLLGAISAGELLMGLRASGRPIGINDALTAGICLRYKLPLATRNVREFGRVNGLQVITPDS
jgi:tRNA(fMet)-specific endonuclease VapC